MCPASCAPDRGQGTPCAQHHVPQTDVSKSFSVQQCAHKGGRVCLQVSPQEPETTRAKTHDLLLAEPPGGGGNRVEAARSGGRNSRMDRGAWQATVHGILQARILEWVAISFFRGSSQPRNNPRDGSPPGSPVPGIFQARTLEWVAISFSNA